jgi:hypothetical protein
MSSITMPDFSSPVLAFRKVIAVTSAFPVPETDPTSVYPLIITTPTSPVNASSCVFGACF